MINSQTGNKAECLTLDGTRLYDFIVSGAGNVILNERNLNRINVFPVPDGDTGTNLALTLRTVIAKARREAGVGPTMDSISKAAVENAYGNSGMIFAQFLHGFAEAVRNKDTLTPLEFADSSALAVKSAYQAVSAPVEGTILTVMREWADALHRHLDTVPFDVWLDQSVTKAREIVEQTKSMMKVFRDRNVVDSGAKGFLLFLEGILAQARHGGEAPAVLARSLAEETEPEPVPLEPPLYRYCSQFSLQVEPGFSSAPLLARMEEWGDSLVLTGDAPLLHLHLHTSSPDRVMALLLEFGQVVSHKADDMALQQDIVANRRHRVGIITDSVADVPEDILRAGQVAVIPVHVIHDGTAYLDKVTMKPERFFQDVDTLSMNPTSAQPTASTLERVFAFMLAHYDEVVGVFVSGRMSGVVRNATAVAERMQVQGKRIRIVDTKQNSGAQGLAVLEAIRLAEAGLSADEVADGVERFAGRSRILVSVATLRYMIKGGRVPRAQGAILSLLNLKPVVSIDPDGKGNVWAKTFTRRQALGKMIHQVRHDKVQHGIATWGLVYADDQSVMEGFKKEAEALIGQPPAFVVPISSVVALNAGRGAFAIAYTTREEGGEHA
jgi:uncharacterized protein